MLTRNLFKQTEQGQALLFVIVAMTVALSVGIALSTRTLSSLRRTTSTDTSTRVFSVAEGGIEWFLRQPTTVMEDLSSDPDSCPAGTTYHAASASCELTYPARDEDTVNAHALVKVGRFNLNEGTGGNAHYWFDLETGSVKEVKLMTLDGASFYRANLQVCWRSLDPADPSALYYVMYNQTGIAAKQLIAPNTTPISPGSNLQGAISADPGRLDFDECTPTFTISSNMVGIRFKSLYAPSKVGVFPSDASTFPTQGYEITSTGELIEFGAVKTTKTVKVFKSYNYLPGIFDYALYSISELGN